MAKFTLTLEDDFNFLLVAICSHSKDYRLSWFLNQGLGISLVKGEDLEMKRKSELYSFSFYSFEDPKEKLEYYLIGNKCLNAHLIPEEKQTDFFLQIKGPMQLQMLNETIKKIKDIPVVLTAYELDAYELKSRKNLIF